MPNYAAHVARRNVSTPQTQAIPGREAVMVKNNAGGAVFPVTDWVQLDRFLIQGCEGGSYYASEQKMTRENAAAVERCIKADGTRVVRTIVEVSQAGRAPKNDPALFALALCAACDDAETRAYALAELPKVARIGTHLFNFIGYVTALRGWGRGLRRAVGRWYASMPADRLAEQLVKYQQRGGWSHRDVLRLVHPVADTQHGILFDWATHRRITDDEANTHDKWVADKGIVGFATYTPMCRGTAAVATASEAFRHIHGFHKLQAATSGREAATIIRDYHMPREAVPTELLNDPVVWEALLEHMPMTAMIRNLGKMSAVGLLKMLGSHNKIVTSALSDAGKIKGARVHPISLLLAMKTYAQGRGDKGKLSWTPVPQIIDALNDAFYLAFANVRPTGKRLLLALDVSGSMGGSMIAGTSLSAREASAAFALVTAATEENVGIVGFGSTLVALDITPKMRLDQVVKKISGIPFGNTDCALPMLYAGNAHLGVDAFVTFTDSETWAGNVHPTQALAMYRKATGIPAKSAVIGATATGFSIADPADAGQMDFVGFDSAVPALLADFIRGAPSGPPGEEE